MTNETSPDQAVEIRDDVPPTVHSRWNEESGKWETPVKVDLKGDFTRPLTSAELERLDLFAHIDCLPQTAIFVKRLINQVRIHRLSAIPTPPPADQTDLIEHLWPHLRAYVTPPPFHHNEDGWRTVVRMLLAKKAQHERAVLQAHASPRELDETGWLIEHEDEPKWLTLRPGEAAYEVCWTKESNDALRFARRDDAEDYAETFMEDGPIRITEHVWTRTALELG